MPYLVQNPEDSTHILFNCKTFYTFYLFSAEKEKPGSLDSFVLFLLYCFKLLLFNIEVLLIIYYHIYTWKVKELYKTTCMHFNYLGGNSNSYLRQKTVLLMVS